MEAALKHSSWFLVLLRPQRVGLALIGWVLVSASPVLAAWPSDPNANLPVCTEVFNQEFPAVLPDGAGGVFIAWQDYRTELDYDLYAQRISASGVPQWGTNGIPVCTAVGDQLVPHLASDGAGGVIVTWNDTRNLLSDIFAQRLSPGGDPLWDLDGVPLCTAPGPQHDETLIPDGQGGVIVTWWDRRADGGSAIYGDIYAQRVNASGVTQWTADGVAICTAAGDQEYPMIVGTDIGALIVWTDARNGSSSRDIYARAITSGGVPLGPADGVIVCNASGDQTSTAIVSDAAGGAIVVWTDPRSSMEETYAQRLSNTAASLWTLGGLSVSTGPSAEFWPAMVSDGSGGAIVTWSDFRNFVTSGADIYAQRISSSGARQWTSAGVALCTFAEFQFFPTITTDGAGGAIVTWQDQRNGASNTDVYARRITAAGTAQWGSGNGGVAISTADTTQYLPMIATDGAGGAILTWQDAREGTTDIYAQRVMSDGQLGGGPVGVSSETPLSADLAPVGPNPIRGGRLRMRFALTTGAAGALELIDVAGRRIATRDLVGLGPGSHMLELGADVHIPAGLYLVRLREGGNERVTRVAMLK